MIVYFLQSMGNADEVATIIGQLSVGKCNSPEVAVRLRRSCGDRGRFSAGSHLDKGDFKLDCSISQSGEGSRAEDEFVLRTVPSCDDLYQDCDDLEQKMKVCSKERKYSK